MAEIAPGGGGPNRLFVVLAVGLGGLLVLGLLAAGGIVLIPRLMGGSAPVPTVKAVTTPTRVVAQATLPPTATPELFQEPTPTLVNAGGLPTAEATGTSNSGQLPEAGLGEDLMVLAGGVVLALIVFAARRARAT